MKKNQGFTIIELLVCIAGIGCIAGFIWVAYVIGHFVSKYW